MLNKWPTSIQKRFAVAVLLFAPQALQAILHTCTHSVFTMFDILQLSVGFIYKSSRTICLSVSIGHPSMMSFIICIIYMTLSVLTFDLCKFCDFIFDDMFLK